MRGRSRWSSEPGSEAGLARIVALVEREAAEAIVVGLPLTLRGERGAQADETERFVGTLRAAVTVPVETYDERFTTRLAARGRQRRPRGRRRGRPSPDRLPDVDDDRPPRLTVAGAEGEPPGSARRAAAATRTRSRP